MPRIILEFFCRGNAIFECDAEQKYQINSQLCGGSAHNAISFLYGIPSACETTELARLAPSDAVSCEGKATMEIVLHVCPDDAELVAGNFKMAVCPAPGAIYRLSARIQSHSGRNLHCLFYTQPGGRVSWPDVICETGE